MHIYSIMEDVDDDLTSKPNAKDLVGAVFLFNLVHRTMMTASEALTLDQN